MNDRIKELFKKAANKDFPTGVGNIHYNQLERFAELIVKDCVEMVRDSLVPSQYKIPANVALDIAAKNIELLFGIK